MLVYNVSRTCVFGRGKQDRFILMTTTNTQKCYALMRQHDCRFNRYNTTVHNTMCKPAVSKNTITKGNIFRNFKDVPKIIIIFTGDLRE